MTDRPKTELEELVAVNIAGDLLDIATALERLVMPTPVDDELKTELVIITTRLRKIADGIPK